MHPQALPDMPYREKECSLNELAKILHYGCILCSDSSDLAPKLVALSMDTRLPFVFLKLRPPRPSLDFRELSDLRGTASPP